MTCLLMITIISVDYGVQILMRFFSGQTPFSYLTAASIVAKLNSIVSTCIYRSFLKLVGVYVTATDVTDTWTSDCTGVYNRKLKYRKYKNNRKILKKKPTFSFQLFYNALYSYLALVMHSFFSFDSIY